MSGDDWTGGIDAVLLSECSRCGRRWYLPHDRCPRCGSSEHDRLPSDGVGTAVAVTVVNGPSSEAPETDPPAGLCLVDLDDGVRVMGRGSTTLRVGDRVCATWVGHQPVYVLIDDDASVSATGSTPPRPAG